MLLEVLSQKKSWQHIISRTFKKISIDEIEDAINESLARQIEIAKQYGLLGEILIIDQHEKAAWHKKHTECPKKYNTSSYRLIKRLYRAPNSIRQKIFAFYKCIKL